MARLVWCENGAHYYERARTPGRVPRSCPLHGRGHATVLAWCEKGAHHYERRLLPGRIPSSCADHDAGRFRSSPVVDDEGDLAEPRATRTRWVGDLKTCFLLDRGWSFRLEVNDYLLAHRGGWRMPVSLAVSLALEVGDLRELQPMRPVLGQTFDLERRRDALLGGPIGTALERLGAVEGDILFVCVRDDQFDLVLRARRELDSADALGRLLWSTGLDPSDEAVRTAPWGRLGRTLGGTSAGIAEVRRRLEQRRHEDLLVLLEETQRDGGYRMNSEAWPPGWQYTRPLASNRNFYALQAPNGSARTALGVADATNQPPRSLVSTEGGLCWVDQPNGFDPDQFTSLLREPPRGLFPAARRPGWVSWMRAEHTARHAALRGVAWRLRLTRREGTWTDGRSRMLDLREALDAMTASETGTVCLPSGRVQQAYPRSSIAFERALERALAEGLQEVAAHSDRGFSALYAADVQRVGMSLLDVFT